LYVIQARDLPPGRVCVTAEVPSTGVPFQQIAIVDLRRITPRRGIANKWEAAMEPMVLVTYATRYGSTEEVALAVAQTLREGGVAVETQPARSVQTLERYGAIVLGVPIYMGRFHKDARRFLSAYRNALTKMPVALFALGPLQTGEKDFAGAWTQLNKELAKHPWFYPVSPQMFGGKFDPLKLDFPFSLIPPIRKLPASDARDWAAIRAWANDLVSELQPVPQR